MNLVSKSAADPAVKEKTLEKKPVKKESFTEVVKKKKHTDPLSAGIAIIPKTNTWA